MMAETWWTLGLLLASLLGGGAGVLAASVFCMALKRRTVSLEFEVAELQDRLLREIKTRASHAAVKAKKDDDEFLAKVTAAAPAPPEPWWMKHVQPDLLKG